MNYCVIKDTVTVIDGSKNTNDIMLKNATNSGFLESEVEILTEKNYQARVELEPIPLQEPSTEERLQIAEETLMFLLMGGM